MRKLCSIAVLGIVAVVLAECSSSNRHHHQGSPLMRPQVAATYPSSCDAATTLTWVTTCTNLTLAPASCWSPARLPTSVDVIEFPVGTNATMYPTWVNVSYAPLLAGTIRVAAGATVILLGDAFNVLGCLDVAGSLVVGSNTQTPVWGAGIVPYTQAPTAFEGNDPKLPEGTDCQKVFVGFTPRLCGPGRFVVRSSAHLEITGMFASLFMNGAVLTGGQFHAHNSGFVWGNVTNAGQFVQDSYMHGFLYNLASGEAMFQTLWYDVWATSFNSHVPPLLVENWGNMMYLGNAYDTNTFYANQPQGPTQAGTYRSILVNYANVSFNYSWNNWMTSQVGGEFDVINYASLTILGAGGIGSFAGQGSFMNKGSIVVNAMSVWLSSFHDVGGSVVLLNGGTFNFGNGAAMATSARRFCHMAQDPESHDKSPKNERAKRQRLETSVASAIQARLPKSLVAPAPKVLRDRDCWWYFGNCYTVPYIQDEAPKVVKAPSIRKLLKTRPGQVDADVHRREPHHLRKVGPNAIVEVAALLRKDSSLSLEASCSLRYSFWNTKITGDGTGSIVTTLPVEVRGRVVLNHGGKWFALAERQSSPVFGDGMIVVGRDGTFVGGIDSDFRSGTNGVIVERGGLFFIPKHAAVHFSNSSLVIRKGGQLRVEGTLRVAKLEQDSPHRLVMCGTLLGHGHITKERPEDLGCA